jgi:hypothetical protein
MAHCALLYENGFVFVACINLFVKGDLTNRSSQPLAVVISTFDFMKQSPEFATLAPASGGSAPSR